VSTVYVDGIALGYGSGDSKKAAEQNAAYSVSQTQTMSIDDENSARILDKLDRISN
jgi:ribonuclease-3